MFNNNNIKIIDKKEDVFGSVPQHDPLSKGDRNFSQKKYALTQCVKGTSVTSENKWS